MIKLLFLVIFLCVGNFSLKADETQGDDQDFMEKLTLIKNPFEDGVPKPVVVAPKMIPRPVETPKPLQIERPRPKPRPIQKPKKVVIPPILHLQGVMVGGDMNEAIIDDQNVPLGGSIKGAKIISVSSKGVELIYKDKKFFLKVE